MQCPGQSAAGPGTSRRNELLNIDRQTFWWRGSDERRGGGRGCGGGRQNKWSWESFGAPLTCFPPFLLARSISLPLVSFFFHRLYWQELTRPWQTAREDTTTWEWKKPLKEFRVYSFLPRCLSSFSLHLPCGFCLFLRFPHLTKEVNLMPFFDLCVCQ